MPCNLKTEVYSRVVGFYTPVQSWNKGKKAEWDQRTAFVLGGGVESNKSAKLRKTMKQINQTEKGGE